MSLQPHHLSFGERLKLTPRLQATSAPVFDESGKVSVTWQWYDQANGVVQWNFTNADTASHSVVLYRSNYVFGDAFFPIYYANSDGRGASATNPQDNFGTEWVPSTLPVASLVDSGVQNNAMPIALVRYGGATDVSASTSQVAFIFTIAPGATWSVLEGGFSASTPPQIQGLGDVTPSIEGQFCIGYDEQRVIDWDAQTQTNFAGYSPNPSTFSTILFDCDPSIPYTNIGFNDNFAQGACATPPPPPNPPCTSLFNQAVADYEAGNYDQMMSDLIAAIECLFTSGKLDIKKFIKHLVLRHL